MTRVWGSCIEPEGMVLDNETENVSCPCCTQTTMRWRIENADGGSINTYIGMSCQACGLYEGSFPDEP